MSLSSPPTQQAVTKRGTNPTNQPSELLFVVPVFPAIGPFKLYLYLNRPAVPDCTTPLSIAIISSALSSLITSLTLGENSAMTLP